MLLEEIPEEKKESHIFSISIFYTILLKWRLNKYWINVINLFKIF